MEMLAKHYGGDHTARYKYIKMTHCVYKFIQCYMSFIVSQ